MAEFGLSEYEIPRGNLRSYEVLGGGNYGEVRYGRLIHPSLEVVWKTLKKEDIKCDDIDKLKKEFKNQKLLNHKNIVKIIGINCYKLPTNNKLEAFGIVMEYMNGGTLDQVIKNHEKDPYDNKQAISWALQAAEALEYMHSLKDARLIHRDIKPENMLLNSQKTVLKICDFGFSRELTSLAKTFGIGTPLYMAPEIYNGVAYNETCDVYSWAVSFWECFTREPPFKECNDRHSLLSILKKNTAYRLHEIPNVSPGIQDLIRECSTYDRTQRPTMTAVVRKLNIEKLIL